MFQNNNPNSIQGNINSDILAILAISSIAQINQEIRNAGFNDYKELCSAINQLEMEIAKAKDEGTGYENQELLLKKYTAIRDQYLKKHEEEVAKQKKTSSIAMWAMIIGAIILMIVAFSVMRI